MLDRALKMVLSGVALSMTTPDLQGKSTFMGVTHLAVAPAPNLRLERTVVTVQQAWQDRQR